MGATATPMPYAEVYSALEQKVIDSVEVQLPAGYNSKLFEVTKYVTKTGHISLITGLVTSAKWYGSLPADQQKILREEALKAACDVLRTAPEARAHVKRMLNQQYGMIDYETMFVSLMSPNSEAREGMASFMEKRQPNWVPEGLEA